MLLRFKIPASLLDEHELNYAYMKKLESIIDHNPKVLAGLEHPSVSVMDKRVIMTAKASYQTDDVNINNVLKGMYDTLVRLSKERSHGTLLSKPITGYTLDEGYFTDDISNYITDENNRFNAEEIIKRDYKLTFKSDSLLCVNGWSIKNNLADIMERSDVDMIENLNMTGNAIYSALWISNIRKSLNLIYEDIIEPTITFKQERNQVEIFVSSQNNDGDIRRTNRYDKYSEIVDGVSFIRILLEEIRDNPIQSHFTKNLDLWNAKIAWPDTIRFLCNVANKYLDSYSVQVDLPKLACDILGIIIICLGNDRTFAIDLNDGV